MRPPPTADRGGGCLEQLRNAKLPVEPPRPSPQRAVWLLHSTSSIGRSAISRVQYDELRAEAMALRAELIDARKLNQELIASILELREAIR
jgi:hypothetical protein